MTSLTPGRLTYKDLLALIRGGEIDTVILSITDDRARFSEEGPQEFDLHPAGAGITTGDSFVGRVNDSEPWTAAIFGRLADQTPYLFLGGRITPRAG